MNVPSNVKWRIFYMHFSLFVHFYVLLLLFYFIFFLLLSRKAQRVEVMCSRDKKTDSIWHLRRVTTHFTFIVLTSCSEHLEPTCGRIGQFNISTQTGWLKCVLYSKVWRYWSCLEKKKNRESFVSASVTDAGWCLNDESVVFMELKATTDSSQVTDIIFSVTWQVDIFTFYKELKSEAKVWFSTFIEQSDLLSLRVRHKKHFEFVNLSCKFQKAKIVS